MKKYKLRKNAEFRVVYRRGKSFSNELLVLYMYKNYKNKDSRFGISVSKKVGKSVVRSRVKRLIRENVRLRYNSIKEGYDCVIIARNPAKDKDYHLIEKSLLNLLEKAGLIKNWEVL